MATFLNARPFLFQIPTLAMVVDISSLISIRREKIMVLAMMILLYSITIDHDKVKEKVRQNNKLGRKNGVTLHQTRTSRSQSPGGSVGDIKMSIENSPTFLPVVS